MTFTEAAVEVLRLVGKPLHYKKITEVAIERDLLSHVGKTPEVTMSSRLATMVKRDRGDAPIIKIKPGVFGLREFSEEQLADLSGDVDELPEVEVEGEEEAADEALPRNGSAEPVQAAPSLRRPLPGADVFPEEDDDDEPIFGGEDEDELGDDAEADDEGEGAAAESAGSGERASGRSKRRKRRRRGAGEDSGEEVRANPREGRAAGRAPRERRTERFEERRFTRRDELSVDLSREPRDGDLLGKDLADAVASVLGQNGARGQSAVRIAEHLVRKGRMAGEPSSLVPTIVASVRADVARRRTQGKRPRFRLDGPVILLTDFLLPQDVVRAEQDVNRAAERQRERARRAFLRRLVELPASGMAELVATWLNAEGVVGLHAVRRPGSGPGELHLAGTLRRGIEEMRLAVVVLRDPREVGRERVIETRGTLHYYDNASAAWIVTCGSVQGGAREEAASVAAGPITLFDGLALAAAMERVSVGLSVQHVAVSALDLDLLDSLRGGPPRERQRDLEPEAVGERDRREGRESREGRARERDLVRARDKDEELDAEPEEAEEAPFDELEDSSEESAAAGETEEGTQQGAGREGGRRRRRRRRRKGRTAGGAESAGTEREEEGLAGEAEAGEDAEAGEEEALDAGEEGDLAQEAYVAYASELGEDDEVPLDRYLDSDYSPVRNRHADVYEEDAEAALDEDDDEETSVVEARALDDSEREDARRPQGDAPAVLGNDVGEVDDEGAAGAPPPEPAEPLRADDDSQEQGPPRDEPERTAPALPDAPGRGEP